MMNAEHGIYVGETFYTLEQIADRCIPTAAEAHAIRELLDHQRATIALPTWFVAGLFAEPPAPSLPPADGVNTVEQITLEGMPKTTTVFRAMQANPRARLGLWMDDIDAAVKEDQAALRSLRQTEETSAPATKKDDHGAGLIHQTIPDMAGTEPRLNIPIDANELDWVQHAASLRGLDAVEYARRAINVSLLNEGVDAVLLRERDEEADDPTSSSPRREQETP